MKSDSTHELQQHFSASDSPAAVDRSLWPATAPPPPRDRPIQNLSWPMKILRLAARYTPFTALHNLYTRELIKNTVPTTNNPDGIARVWAYIGDDDPTRGDSHGAVGLAQRVAEKLNGTYLYVDLEMIEKSFPHTATLACQMAHLTAKYGSPDIVIGTTAGRISQNLPFPPTLQISTINESMSNYCKNNVMRELSSHHLNAEILACAKTEFESRHDQISGPLIAVFVVEDVPYYASNLMPELAQMSVATPNCTLYFCPSRRVSENAFNSYIKKFNESLSALGPHSVNVLTASHKQINNEYNPYTGLIAKADHAVFLGYSQSMLSEWFFTGRSAYFSKSEHARISTKHLHKAGYINIIEDQKPGTPFKTQTRPALDVTEEISSLIQDAFKKASYVYSMSDSIPRAFNPFSGEQEKNMRLYMVRDWGIQ